MNGLHGWAFDRKNKANTAYLHIIIDGQEIGQVACGGSRPDVEAALTAPLHVGLSFDIPASLMDGRSHELTIRDSLRNVVQFAMNNRIQESLSFTIDFHPRVISFIDGFRNGGIEGWLLRTTSSDAALQGNAILRIEWQEITIGHVRTAPGRTWRKHMTPQ